MKLQRRRRNVAVFIFLPPLCHFSKSVFPSCVGSAASSNLLFFPVHLPLKLEILTQRPADVCPHFPFSLPTSLMAPPSILLSLLAKKSWFLIFIAQRETECLLPAGIWPDFSGGADSPVTVKCWKLKSGKWKAENDADRSMKMHVMFFVFGNEDGWICLFHLIVSENKSENWRVRQRVSTSAANRLARFNGPTRQEFCTSVDNDRVSTDVCGGVIDLRC